MVFYVYLDPEVIRTARAVGDFGLQALVAILRAFAQNCVLLDFDDYRGHTEIKRQLNEASADSDRAFVKKCFALLEKRKRFLYCLKDDYLSGKTPLQFVFEQATAVELDLVLTEEATAAPAGFPVEVSSLRTYQNSRFEDERSNVAANGRVYAGGEEDANAFLNTNLRKALRAATRIDICDKLFGEKFKSNFEYTARCLLQWLDGVLLDPANCQLVFHCGEPVGTTSDFIVQRLASFRRGSLVNTRVTVQFYALASGDAALPHERFIATDQFALEIGRGMDFLDKKTGRNRDVSINLKREDDIARVLREYSPAKLRALSVP